MTRALAAPARLVRPLGHMRGALQRMLELQEPGGAIPWFEGGAWDPWNHAECLMALGVMGEHEAAARGFDHLSASQGTDGGWACGYGNAVPMADRLHVSREPAPVVRDTNFAAYPATALWHRYRLTGDVGFVGRHWPMARAGIAFALRHQHADGDISWSSEAYGSPADDAVLSGNASIHASIGHGLALADLLGDPQPGWVAAQARLGETIRTRPARFDRAGIDRSGFAMDWYYPVLAGLLTRSEARARLRFSRARFIEVGRGCRCVASEPWVTVAESAELTIALVRLGLFAEAAVLLGWQEAHRDGDGAYWMGWQFAENIAWPLEKPGWTQAAAILAYDALLGVTPACDVLSGA